MEHPSVADILHHRGYRYEADRMDELTTAFEQAIQNEKEKKDARQRPHSAH